MTPPGGPAIPSVQLTKQQIADLVRRGIIPPQPKGGRKKKPKAAELVAPDVFDDGEVLIFTLPIKTVSEANQRAWKERSARTREARAVVSKHLGPHLRKLADYAEHYHEGGPILVRITRMGGPRLDQMANLGTALKAVEDAVCLMLGADDGDPRWKATAAQEPGGPLGVRVELRTG